jgi:hypothetical protein
MSTLSDGTTTVTLPDDLQWVDEFDWHPVVAKTGRTVTGALWVQESAITAGRPITLQGDVNYAWVPRSAILGLQTLAALVGVPLTLTRFAVARTVMFDREQAKPIEVKPIIDYAEPDNADNYQLTVRLRTVA